ncbi:CHAT domain-containing protein [Aquimarina megaterium]|uniref:CHAT domain-containing protein n=1 Tax=Aquimarina megaterium TaxID=1443666 RepID=UPI0004B898B7|nr:CHAT domain-containing protein [Aquimarina megaterium]
MKKLASVFLTSFFSIILCVLSLQATHAQATNDTLLAAQYYKKADSLLIDKKYDESIELFKKALPMYKKAQAWERLAACYNRISENQLKNRKLEEALSSAKKALEISTTYLKKNSLEETNAHENIGEYYFKKSEYINAIDNYEKVLNSRLKVLLKNDMLITQSYSNVGKTHFKLGSYDEAIWFFKKCLKINKNLFGEEHLNTAKVYNDIGSAFREKRLYHKALEYYQKALNIRIKIFGENHPLIGSSYMNIGVLLKNRKQNCRALDYHQKALKIYLSTFGERSYKLIPIYMNIGVTYNDMKMYNVAIKYFEKGQSLILNFYDDKHSFVARSYNNLGKAYEGLKEFEISIDYFLKSQDIYRKNMGSRSSVLASAYNYTAMNYFKNKKYNNSLQYYRKAIEANSKYDKAKIEKNNFNPGHFFFLNRLVTSLEGMARTLKVLYQKKNKIKHLRECVETYNKMDIVISEIRQSIHSYEDKVIYSNDARNVCFGAIEAQLLLYEIENAPELLDKAFYYAEKNKANTLKELLIDVNAKNFAGLPEDLVTLEKELRTNRSFYQSRVTKEQSEKEVDTSKVTYYENKLFDINRTQDSLTQVLEKNYPKYHQLKYKNDIVSVSDIQQQLDDTTTLLEFFTGDSITYAFSISKHDISVQELSTPKLTEQIEAFRKSIIAKNTGTYKQQAYALYNTLIAPVKDKLVGDQLIIIPDGPLWHLNFELLLTQKDDSNNPALLSYLLKKYAITYANSANLLFTTFKSDQKTKPLQECLAFSFSDSTQITDTYTMSLATLRSAGMDLPGTRKEIKAISDIIDGQYYFGSQAIEVNFKSNASQYNILHLALHGEVDNERPENSKLYFTRSKDTIEDNLLYSHELFALDIPAELTVLSACNTGSGKIAKGEGIMSLGTAFQYAGTKSLLLTSWEVSDQTTPELMKYFYTNLKAGMHKGKALQQAKLQYLSTANINRTDPFYWGGFYLVGDTTAMQFNNNTQLYWILGLGAIAAILLVVFLYRRRTKNA